MVPLGNAFAHNIIPSDEYGIEIPTAVVTHIAEPDSASREH